MRWWVRRGIAAALLLSAGALALAFVRLDAGELQEKLAARVELETGLKLHSSEIRLSPLHGLSLKLAQFRLGTDTDAWHLEADVVRVDVSLWSLLSGEPEFPFIDLVRPSLYLNKSVSPQAMFAFELPDKVEHLRIRKGRILIQQRLLANGMQAELRRIVREKKVVWEVQSHFAGGGFSSHGYIDISEAGHRDALGKVSASKVQVAQLQALPLPSLHYDTLDASLTFGLSAGRWKWSGNLVAQDVHGELPEMSWRGKISGRGSGDFHLYDSLALFGAETRLQINGGCQSGQPCRLDVETRGADAGLLLNAFALQVPLKARLDANVSLQQRQEGWHMSGKLTMRKTRWSGVMLPDATLDLSGLRFTAIDDFDLQHSIIRPLAGSGEVAVDVHRHNGKKDVLSANVEMKGLDDVWLPFGNAVLQSMGEDVRLSGSGRLSGRASWLHGEGDSRFYFELDATDAALAAKGFSKPAGMRAEMIGDYRRDAKETVLEIGELQLGDSRVSKAEWVRSVDVAWASAGAANINLDSLRSAGLILPDAYAIWHGKIDGNIKHVSLAEEQFLQALVGAEGHLALKGFGSGQDVWSGDVRLYDGVASSRMMNWQRGSQFADVSGEIDLRSGRASLDIRRAGIEWAADDGLPHWLESMQVGGEFADVDVRWGGNTWKGMRGRFSTADGGLVLQKVHGHLAGGRVYSRHMQIRAVPGGVHLDGRMRMSVVHLGKLKGLAGVFGADMDGYIFFNGYLSGQLPLGSGGTWRGNGDIEVHRGSWKAAKAAHLIRWNNPEADAAAGDIGERFTKLAARYRLRATGLQLRRLHFNRGGWQGSGRAVIDSQGKITGRLQLRREEQRLATDISGRWPSASDFFTGAARHP